MKPGALTLERIAQGLSPDWTAEDRLLVVASILPGMQDDIYAGTYSAIGRPNITSLQHILSMPAEECEAYREEIEKRVKAFQDLCAGAVAPAGSTIAVTQTAGPATLPTGRLVGLPVETVGTLTPARRFELAQIGHRVAAGMRKAMEDQETALRLAVRGLVPHSDDAIEAMAIVLATFVRIGMDDVAAPATDDFVDLIVNKAAEGYAHVMPPEFLRKLVLRTKVLVKAPAETGRPVDLPS